MELLAIKSEIGKGVYIIENKNDKKEILEKYPGCSHRIFKENEKKSALKWADVKEISNRSQQVVNIPSTNNSKQGKHEFIQTLEDLRKLGYTYAELNLSNGKNFKLWLDDIKIFSASVRLYFQSFWSSYDYNKYDFNYCSAPDIQFNDFKEQLDKNSKEYKEREDFDEINMLYEAIKYLNKKSFFCRIVYKPEITINGNFIKISHVFKDVSNSKEIDTIDDILDVAINQNNIVSITPYRWSKEINDERYHKAINKLIADNILDKNGKFL